MKLEYVNCNLCGYDGSMVLFKKRGVITKLIFCIVKCKKCNLVYVNPRLDSDSLKNLYGEDYFKSEGFDKTINYINSASSVQKKEEVSSLIQHILALKENLRFGNKLLEVGFGMGNFLQLAREEGFDTEGVEISEYACKRMRELGFKVHQGYLEEVSLGDNTYDIVVAIEVLEHLPDPKRFIKNVYKILKPGGLFYHSTANFQRIKRQGAKAKYIMPEGHLYYFTYSTMREFLLSAGFKILTPYQCYQRQRKPIKMLMKYGLICSSHNYPKDLKEKFIYQLFKIIDQIIGNRQLPLGIK